MFKRYKKLKKRLKSLENELGLVYEEAEWGHNHAQEADCFVDQVRKHLDKGKK